MADNDGAGREDDGASQDTGLRLVNAQPIVWFYPDDDITDLYILLGEDIVDEVDPIIGVNLKYIALRSRKTDSDGQISLTSGECHFLPGRCQRGLSLYPWGVAW